MKIGNDNKWRVESAEYTLPEQSENLDRYVDLLFNTDLNNKNQVYSLLVTDVDIEPGKEFYIGVYIPVDVIVGHNVLRLLWWRRDKKVYYVITKKYIFYINSGNDVYIHDISDTCSENIYYALKNSPQIYIEGETYISSFMPMQKSANNLAKLTRPT